VNEPVEVVTLGEALAGFVAREVGPLELASTFERHIVGAEFNTAVGLRRLGRTAAFIGRVGDDALGRAVMRALRADAVDVRHVGVEDARPTGMLIRARRGGAASEVVYHRAGSAGSALSPNDVAEARDTIAAARRLHVSGVTPALSETCRDAVELAMTIASESGTAITLDINLRRKLWDDGTARTVLLRGIERVSTVLGNEDELEVLSGERSWEAAAGSLLALGVDEVVVKRGAEGAVLVRRDASPVAVPARAVVPIDPVGAGDGFDAGYLAGRLAGLDDLAVLRLANACGALAAGSIGDTTGLPTASELEHLATHPDEARR
jgi:2-dehydro-3-deoxygluconokinase